MCGVSLGKVPLCNAPTVPSSPVRCSVGMEKRLVWGVPGRLGVIPSREGGWVGGESAGTGGGGSPETSGGVESGRSSPGLVGGVGHFGPRDWEIVDRDPVYDTG